MGRLLRLVHPTRVLSLHEWGDAQRARDACPGAVVLMSGHIDEDASALEVSVEGFQGQGVVLAGESSDRGSLVLGEEWASRLWLARGARVYALPDNLAQTDWIDLKSEIWEIRLFRDVGVLIAICEADVVAIDENLTLRWSTSTDLITGIRWRPQHLLITKMDDPTVQINLSTGVQTLV